VAQVIGNFAQVQAALLSLIPRVQVAAEAIEETGARIIAADAERRAPVLTGELRASIGEEGGEVVATSDHAIFVEYGTRRSKAQPFLRPAKDAMTPIVYKTAEELITAATR
jgi:HK97 gp10 family phage protein